MGGIDVRAGRIALAEGLPREGLAGMLADIIDGNLARAPHKETDFARLDGTVDVEASDADVRVTLAFRRGSLRISGPDGVEPTGLWISASAEDLISLCRLRIAHGVPVLTDADGARVAAKILTGKVRIRGLLRHPIRLVRLTRLLSVNG
jgi:hypothetical protein